ncbi:MAG: MBL fold metallo-hydrolase [Acidobacteriota bacterium]
MKLTVLGSGTTITSPGTDFRYSAAYLIETENEKILFDASTGVLPQLAKIGVNLLDIDAICISHYHADHFVVEPILQAFFVPGINGEPDLKLRILGPSDIEERVRTSYKTKGWTFDTDLLKYADVAFTPYEAGKSIRIGQSNLIPHKTTHLELEAYALRLEEDGKTIAYSGDTGVDPAIGAAAKEADLFLCEANVRVGKPGSDVHIGAGDAGRIAKEQNVKQLVLTHYTGLDSTGEMVDEARSAGFSGKAAVAKDLDSFLL